MRARERNNYQNYLYIDF
ncbi:hypothetical protein C5167_015216 [Papaver somniferum]|uniref:Uncharacterized protein n=1 Tax=Papaver somniferum TaxID=3469 RepID=A0A4Y7J7C0_PAPSO|nr:hypothetical protein C5167_015216 [Papaver somniferum]